jgi:thiol-disulfide isomerase/thioredoxin
MKKLLALFVLSITVLSCDNEPKDYVTLSGKITNPHSEKTIKIFRGNDYEKIITVKVDGTFSDTLKVVAGDYSFKHGDEYGSIYLKNDNISSFTTDYEDFDNTLSFEGDDADNNNFSIRLYRLGNTNFNSTLFNDGKKEDIVIAVNNYKEGYKNLKLELKNVDSIHIANADKNIPKTIESVERYFNSKLALREALPKGSPSPIFENYENFKGGTTSLSDLKGKYVYVDVWATWCGPCKREIPSLKKIEGQYEGKNIEFVSISIDDARRSGSLEKAHASWKKMIVEKDLKGIQLFSDKAWQSDFIRGYKIDGIPRFILIDPDGNIVTADAPRPSNPKLIELFDELKI